MSFSNEPPLLLVLSCHISMWAMFIPSRNIIPLNPGWFSSGFAASPFLDHYPQYILGVVSSPLINQQETWELCSYDIHDMTQTQCCMIPSLWSVVFMLYSCWICWGYHNIQDYPWIIWYQQMYDTILSMIIHNMIYSSCCICWGRPNTAPRPISAARPFCGTRCERLGFSVPRTRVGLMGISRDF